MRKGFLVVSVFTVLILASGSAAAQSLLKTRNVVLIVSDGLRWQEVFYGPDVKLMESEQGGVSNPDSLQKAFWRDAAVRAAFSFC